MRLLRIPLLDTSVWRCGYEIPLFALPPTCFCATPREDEDRYADEFETIFLAADTPE